MPFPGQGPYPGQPGPQPYPGQPFGQRPVSSGNPVGAVFLGFVVSFVVSLLYTGVIMATYKDQSNTTANVLYFAHALLNGALVGALVGRMAPASNGARISGSIIAALGTFFGYANAIPFVILEEQSDFALRDMLKSEPFFPAKAWWHDGANGGVDWLNLLGLLVAVAAVWAVAHLVGNKRPQAHAGPNV